MAEFHWSLEFVKDDLPIIQGLCYMAVAAERNGQKRRDGAKGYIGQEVERLERLKRG
jgi:hypothetical protein